MTIEHEPRLQHREALRHPEYLDRALAPMSIQDRRVIEKLRHSFDTKGPNQRWYYAAAGTDILPVLIAPPGTTHEFVDPVYTMDGDRNASHLRRKLESSFLRDANGVVTVDQDQGVESILPDGTHIEWQGVNANRDEHCPEDIDVIYTNLISQQPSAKALNSLKPHGYLVVAVPPGMVDYRISHPTQVRSLTEMGFVLCSSEARIEHVNPGESQEFMGYGYNQPKQFNIYEKTRDLTSIEQLVLELNAINLNTYNNLRALVYRMPAIERNPALMEEHITDIISFFQRTMDEFESKISQLPSHDQEYMKNVFMIYTGNRLLEPDAASKVTAWMMNVDRETGEFDFQRNLNANNTELYQEGILKIINAAAERVRNLL